MARSFNGSSDVISMGTGGGVGASTPWSSSSWVNLSSLLGNGTFACIVAKRDSFGGSNPQFEVFLLGDGVNNKLGAAVHGIFTSAGNVTANAWASCVTTADGSTLDLYINGTNVLTDSNNWVSGSNTNEIFEIGADQTGAPQEFFPGRIADVAIWNVKLTAGEATGLSMGARPNMIRPANLKGWWPLDGIQSPEPDLSGFALNGTLTGTAFVTGPPIALFTPRWPIFSAAPTTSDIPNISTQSAFIKRLPYAIGY